jgi:hypothetical protein
MINDILCIENIFDNPKQIVDLAKQQKYYSFEDNPTVKNTNIKYSGRRTDHLSNILTDNDYYNITNKIVSKLFVDVPSVKVKLQPICLFHYLTEHDIPSNSWIHKDTSLYSGVIYLNETFVDRFNNHGTKIIKDNKEINIRNEFNKLVLYRGDYSHSANFGFGQTLDDSRLTLNFFINEMCIDLKNINKVKENYYDYKK